MKKVFSLILALVLVLSLAVNVLASSGTEYVYDEADLLTASEEERLADQLRQISSTYNAQIVVATVLSVPYGDADAYVEELYDSMGFGYGAYRDGVLLLISILDREYRILSNGLAGDAIGDYEIDRISDDIVSDLSDGDYADACGIFADRCAYYLEGAVNGYPFDLAGNLMLSLVVGLIAGVVVAFILKAQLKSVKRQEQAVSYIRSGSFQLTNRSDLFLYRNVHRSRKQTSSSSGPRSGGGGSRHVGGGRF